MLKAARCWGTGIAEGHGCTTGWVPGAHQGAQGEEEEAGHRTEEVSPTLTLPHAPGTGASARGSMATPPPAAPPRQPSAEPSPHHRSGPGFHHPSITCCLLLLTAHLLALVKHTVNSERKSPALPDLRNSQEGAGQSLPAVYPSTRASAARKGQGAGSVHACWHHQQPQERDWWPGFEKC